MNVARRRKLLGIIIVVFVLSLAIALVLYALRQNISLFYSPSQIAEGQAPKNHFIRVGGMVTPGSINRSADSLVVSFTITDYKNTLKVTYEGILPDLFREGQGIVAQGQLSEQGMFKAREVLAKHDENYMPPEVKSALNPKG